MGQRLNLDEYAQLDSWIHRWEPRVKITGLLMLIFAFAFVKQALLLPWMGLIVVSLYALSRLPLAYLGHRLKYPGYFIAGVVILLPFCSGDTVLWQWGPIGLRQEGVEAMLLVVGRFLAIVITGFVLLGTMPFLQAMQALRSLGLPQILTDMTLLAYRYLYEIAEMLATMQQAMRLRGFGYLAPDPLAPTPWRSRWQRLHHVGFLAGTLLLRSYEQSERVYQAMQLRGYGRSTPGPTGVFTWAQLRTIDRGSWLGFGLTVSVAMAFILAELLLA